MSFDTHGRIKCGTVSTHHFDDSVADYRDLLGLELAGEGEVPGEMAELWGRPASAGRRTALFRPRSGSPGFLRLVEGNEVPGYRPFRSFGWAAYEMTVQNVFPLHERLKDGPFEIIGPPKHVEGFDNFIPMQVKGRGGEILYLNEVLQSMSDLDLPKAQSGVDHMFIAVLAVPDLDAALAFHTEKLGFEAGGRYTLTYDMINTAFGFAKDRKHTIAMTKVGRLPATEIDQYPGETVARPGDPRALPPGNAMLSFAVRSLDAAKAPFVAPPRALDGPLYDGRRTAVVKGTAGELIELIEVG